MGEDARREQDAFERLTAADPAQGATPRLDALRRTVEALRADDGASGVADTAPGTTDPAPGAVVLPLVPAASRRPRVGRRGWAVAAAVAGFAVVGGGGYLAGANRGSADTAAPAPQDAAAVAQAGGFALPGSAAGGITLGADQYASGDARGGLDIAQPESATLEARAFDVAEPMPGLGTVRAFPGGWGGWGSGGRTVFHQQGLSEDGGSAPAFAFAPQEVASAETAAHLAAVLGVAGDVVAQTQWTPSWSVGGGGDWTSPSPSLWLSGDGRASFGFWNPAADPWQCLMVDVVPLPADVPTVLEAPEVVPEVLPEDFEEADGGGAPAVEPAVPPVVEPRRPCEQPAPSTLSDADAATMLADVMRALGVDPAGFEVEVAPNDHGAPTRAVTAWHVVGGTRTQAMWWATVSDAGITSLDGFLAPVVELGEYPVVSPAEAVRRLSDPRFGASSVIAGAVPEVMPVVPGETTAVPAAPQPGAPLPWAVTEVTIVGARLGLAQQWTADGAVLFLPAYELTDDQGTTWSVLAVADSALDFARR